MSTGGPCAIPLSGSGTPFTRSRISNLQGSHPRCKPIATETEAIAEEETAASESVGDLSPGTDRVQTASPNSTYIDQPNQHLPQLNDNSGH